MSLTAVLVLTVVVLVAMAGWLGTVFFVGREPRSGLPCLRPRDGPLVVARPGSWLVANIGSCRA